MNYAIKWTGISIIWGALVFGGLTLAFGPPGQHDPPNPEPRYGDTPEAVAAEADCLDYHPSANQFPPKQLIGTCTVDDITFEINTFDTGTSQTSFLLTNSFANEPLYYVYTPGAVFRSPDSTDSNYNDPSVYLPTGKAAQTIADDVDGIVFTADQMRRFILGGGNDA